MCIMYTQSVFILICLQIVLDVFICKDEYQVNESSGPLTVHVCYEPILASQSWITVNISVETAESIGTEFSYIPEDSEYVKNRAGEPKIKIFKIIIDII